jgi:hypothetical protein
MNRIKFWAKQKEESWDRQRLETRMNKWKSKWKFEQANERANRGMLDRWTKESPNEQMKVQMKIWASMNEQTEESSDRQTIGNSDGQTMKVLVKWMEIRIGKQTKALVKRIKIWASEWMSNRRMFG